MKKKEKNKRNIEKIKKKNKKIKINLKREKNKNKKIFYLQNLFKKPRKLIIFNI